MKVGVVHFPGSENPELFINTLRCISQHDFSVINWNQSELPPKLDFLIIPGGCSFSDSLGPGTLAKLTPASALIKKAAKQGIPIFGIGNGFQILCHLGLLPGCFVRTPDENKVRCNVHVKALEQSSDFDFDEKPYLSSVSAVFGRYFLDKRAVERLEEKKLISHKFCDKRGNIGSENPYLSSNQVAGIFSDNKKICGVIFHPERTLLPNKITSGLPKSLAGTV